MRRILALCGGALLAFYAVGCGGPPPPVRAQTNATAAIRSARVVGAERTPPAAYHLELAEENFAEAQNRIALGDMAQAERMLVRAQADAELAIALTNEARVAREAEALQTRIREMRERHL